MTTQVGSITLRDDNFPLLSQAIFTQETISKNGNYISLDRLGQLRVALDALQPNPPNASTVWHDNTLLLQTVGGNPTNTLTPTTITIDNTIDDTLKTTINPGDILLQDTSGSEHVEINYGNIIMNDNFYISYNQITGNGSSDLAIVNPNTTISMGDPDHTGGYTELVVDDSNKNIRVIQPNQNNGLFSVYSGKSCRVIYLDDTNNHITFGGNYFVSEGTTVYTYPATHYLTMEATTEGYFFFLSNASSSTITISADDGGYFYQVIFGQVLTITLLPWATLRFTLVQLPSDGERYWSVI